MVLDGGGSVSACRTVFNISKTWPLNPDLFSSPGFNTKDSAIISFRRKMPVKTMRVNSLGTWQCINAFPNLFIWNLVMGPLGGGGLQGSGLISQLHDNATC